MSNYVESRPWGSFEILIDEKDYKLKKIIVYPSKRISLQYHLHRSEIWIIAQGTGKITKGSEIINCTKDFKIEIPVNTLHRIENIGTDKLVFIEYQFGKILSEDDIVRIDDDFNRI